MPASRSRCRSPIAGEHGSEAGNRASATEKREPATRDRPHRSRHPGEGALLSAERCEDSLWARTSCNVPRSSPRRRGSSCLKACQRLAEQELDPRLRGGDEAARVLISPGQQCAYAGLRGSKKCGFPRTPMRNGGDPDFRVACAVSNNPSRTPAFAGVMASGHFAHRPRSGAPSFGGCEPGVSG